MTALAGLLRHHGDAVEADLAHFYGVDLAQLWTGGLSLRRLSVLIANLPPGSATWAAEHGLPLGAVPGDLVLADIFEALTGQTHPLKPTPAAARSAATRHETLAARLRAQRLRVAQASRKEARV
ncbi:hypothetical protein [Krasilnikovia sp. MM14-A1259]|uniref:hypothetical protein n=1 Tax=Krasilnikovia sp. MM14-A1259 TaxID=3373539 RepID=UPI0037F402EB